MNIELKMLLWSIVLGLVTIGIAAMLSTAQRVLAGTPDRAMKSPSR